MNHPPNSHSADWPIGLPRPATIEPPDLPAVHSLIARCYAEFGLTLNLEDPCEAHLLDPAAHFRANGGDYWVIRDHHNLVRATVALDLHQPRPAAPPEAELKSMYVDPSWRRRGVGRALTTHVIHAARAKGCRELLLWTDTRFEPAHRMYESLGFVRQGRRDIQDSNNSAEWGYRLSLEPGKTISKR